MGVVRLSMLKLHWRNGNPVQKRRLCDSVAELYSTGIDLHGIFPDVVGRIPVGNAIAFHVVLSGLRSGKHIHPQIGGNGRDYLSLLLAE